MRRQNPGDWLRLVALSAGISLAGVAAGWAGEPSTASARPVASVGKRGIDVAEVEARMRRMPAAQLHSLGNTAQDRARQVLERILIPEALYGESAQLRNTAQDPSVRVRIDQVLRSARVEALAGELRVSTDEIARYYEEHRPLFESPLRVGLWRILCASAEEARTVLTEAKSGINAWRWKDLSREHSTDRATKWRGGDLGFVAADGTSSEPALRVDPVLFAAADKVRDGELVPEPVPEGSGYAVVWRRETMPPTHRTLEQESEAIRQVILRRKLEDGVRELVGRLRQEARPTAHPELIAMLGDVRSRAQGKPPALSSSARTPAGRPQPSSTPRGIR